MSDVLTTVGAFLNAASRDRVTLNPMASGNRALPQAITLSGGPDRVLVLIAMIDPFSGRPGIFAESFEGEGASLKAARMTKNVDSGKTTPEVK